MKELRVSKLFDIRFSEVDSMQFVWHGSYSLYFEDAREAFGKQFDLGYMTIFIITSRCVMELNHV